MYLLEWLKSIKLTIPVSGEGAEQQKFLFSSGGNIECQFLRKLNIFLNTVWESQFYVFIHQFENYVHTKSCTQMFTEVLFIIAQNSRNRNAFQ